MPTQEITVSRFEESTGVELLARVDRLIDTARQSQEILERTYLDIGIALKDVQDSRAWAPKFHSFDAYLREWCEPRFNRKRNQLYAYKTAAEQLLPHVDKQKLLEMGVTKATALSGYVKNTGKVPSEEMIEDAQNPEVGFEQFKAKLQESQHQKPEKGAWFDMGGFFATPEEKEEIERVFVLARNEAEIPENCPDWLARKLMVQAMVMECSSSWTGNGQ